MNLVSKPSENQFNSRGQNVLPIDNNFPSFKIFPQRSDSIDNSNNRASPSNNGQGITPKNPSPTDIDEHECNPLAVSPFRLFGTSTTVSASNQTLVKTPNANSLKKFSSTTDKPRRKRTPKVEDNSDGQKVKRRKSELNMNQKQLTLMELQTPITTEKKVNLNPELFTAKNSANYREIGFSPVSSAQSDSGSNSNHTSESSNNSTTNSKQTQTDIIGAITSTSNELEAKNSQIQMLTRERDDLRRQLTDTKKDLDKQTNILQKCLGVNKKLLVEKSTLERKQARQKCMENRLRLGQFVTQRQGATFVENWTDGTAFTDITRQQEMLQRAREELERERRNLLRRRPIYEVKEKPIKISVTRAKSKDRGSSSLATNDESSNDGIKTASDANKAVLISDWYESDEVLRLRNASLKKEEVDLQIEYEKLERERNLHIRELKRIYNEDHSRFQDHPVLNDRYLLLSLIGKGGFSEVHKAFCLKEQRYVAVKVHQLNKEWKEEKKANYIKHALRECDILKTLDHPRIVRLYDVFEIDTDSFCTVLEYIEGNDIDFFLKQHKVIPEKEARSVMMQTVSALRYLNNGIKPPVIHFDLKPANILLGSGTSSGEIKITDFGLSKQMCEDTYDPEHGMDLTSQGAGTYWYLPPEVFVQGPNPPKISSKVDVWSLGCIFFQCLYGRKPYGHNQSQAAILENQTILKAKEIEFPAKPIVSDGAKTFIRRCLTYSVRDRPDVNLLADDEYLRSYPKRATTNASARTAQLTMNDGSN
ncbi:unnamed protein product [Rotaria socialis]|uniref:Protein kinase domain-containing protein n=2 Tax=Rotaria socialis TaxID=392032 RepID=A0A817YUK9_9BILA|nr:unnamed protein product [Rotaria socialis]CAF3383967.1 unnamed protein product [Rotaria socialis]CAF3403091.1 unnamed protein product [Rotaria socialis]CAF3533788.1 unnamed protein product [Rotaria socialis]CAF3741849.1 unnamed protein product [Rotaria socialis]